MRSGNSPQDQPFFWGVSPGYRTGVLTWQCLWCDKTFTITSSMKLPKMTFGHFLKVVGFWFSMQKGCWCLVAHVNAKKKYIYIDIDEYIYST